MTTLQQRQRTYYERKIYCYVKVNTVSNTPSSDRLPLPPLPPLLYHTKGTNRARPRLAYSSPNFSRYLAEKDTRREMCTCMYCVCV